MNLTSICRHSRFVRFERLSQDRYRLLLVYLSGSLVEVCGELSYVITEGAARLAQIDAERDQRVFELVGQMAGQAL